MSAPYFPLYADDFLAGTMDLGPEEVGAYIRLLCHQWNRGALPADGAKLKRLAGGSVSADLLAKFQAGADGLLRNARLEKVRTEMLAFRELQSRKGKASAEARRNRGSTAVQPRLPDGEAPAGVAADIRNAPKSNSPLPPPLPDKDKGGNYPLGESLTTAPPDKPSFEGATNHPPSEGAVVEHFRRLGADFTADEIHAVWLSFEADAFNGQWMWGKRPVGDWRASFERRLSDERAKKTARAGSGKGGGTSLPTERITEERPVKAMTFANP